MARPQLCAVDQSMEAREAADVAGRLALRLDAGLVFAHVLPYVAGGKLAQERTVDTARHLLRHVASVHASTCEARFRVASGDPPQKIMEMAREEDAQMVVVGRCSRGRVKADVRGSVSRSLAARCLRPVVIVPAGAADDFRRNLLEQTCSVVCGVDGSEESELAARHAARLAEHLRVRLVLAHAYGQGVAPARAGALPPNRALTFDDEMRAGRQILERTGERIAADVDVTLRLELGEAAAAIKHVARLESAAVVVTGSRGRGVVASTLLGSVSKRLVAWAERPTVVISPHAARPTGDRSRPAAKEASSRRAS